MLFMINIQIVFQLTNLKYNIIKLLMILIFLFLKMKLLFIIKKKFIIIL